jgi:hypothetical protein
MGRPDDISSAAEGEWEEMTGELGSVIRLKVKNQTEFKPAISSCLARPAANFDDNATAGIMTDLFSLDLTLLGTPIALEDMDGLLEPFQFLPATIGEVQIILKFLSDAVGNQDPVYARRAAHS